MKVELHINGTHEIILKPETEIERLVLSTMAESAEKGRTVTIQAVRTTTTGVEEVPPGTLMRATIGVPA